MEKLPNINKGSREEVRARNDHIVVQEFVAHLASVTCLGGWQRQEQDPRFLSPHLSTQGSFTSSTLISPPQKCID